MQNYRHGKYLHVVNKKLIHWCRISIPDSKTNNNIKWVKSGHFVTTDTKCLRVTEAWSSHTSKLKRRNMTDSKGLLCWLMREQKCWWKDIQDKTKKAVYNYYFRRKSLFISNTKVHHVIFFPYCDEHILSPVTSYHSVHVSVLTMPQVCLYSHHAEPPIQMASADTICIIHLRAWHWPRSDHPWTPPVSSDALSQPALPFLPISNELCAPTLSPDITENCLRVMVPVNEFIFFKDSPLPHPHSYTVNSVIKEKPICTTASALRRDVQIRSD